MDDIQAFTVPLAAGGTLAMPADGAPQQLLVLVAGPGQPADALAALQARLRATFAQAAIAVLPPLASTDELLAALRAAQAATGLGEQATALFGHGAGARLAMQLALAHDGAAGRVVAFGCDLDAAPTTAPEATTLHWLHAALDAHAPLAQAQTHFDRLADLGADATLDVAEGVAHSLAPVLIDEALRRLRGHIPARTWRAAMAGQG